MIKSILVAIDDSKYSNYALNYAVELASKFSAKLKGLYVEDIKRILKWQPPEMKRSIVNVATKLAGATLTSEQKKVESEIVQEGFKLQAKFDETLSKNKVEGYFSVTRGEVGELIGEASKTVDLVVVGKRGTQDKKEYDPGPTITSLMKNTIRPIIVVSQETKHHFDTLLAYDGSETSQRALMFLAPFLLRLGAKLSVINIANSESESESLFVEVREFLKPYGIKAYFYSTVGVLEPWNGILEYALEIHTGLIALGMQGRNKSNLLKSMFGSTAKTILSASKRPVLLIR